MKYYLIKIDPNQEQFEPSLEKMCRHIQILTPDDYEIIFEALYRHKQENDEYTGLNVEETPYSKKVKKVIKKFEKILEEK